MSDSAELFNHEASKRAHEDVYGDKPSHHSSLSHELISGAAGFAAMKSFEDHIRKSGGDVSHPLMKEMLAAFAAAEVDKLFETKGLDMLDREKAKVRATEQAHHLANEKFGAGDSIVVEHHRHHHHHRRHHEE